MNHFGAKRFVSGKYEEPILERPHPWVSPRAAYIHIPFCAHHCGYCDFAVVTGQDHQIDLYLEALGVELSHLREPHPVDTIFFGGGTPTHPSARQLRQLLATVREWLPLRPEGEWTIEANPDNLDAERLEVLAEGGVNRLSIGIQSFHEHVLSSLDRRHRAEQIPRILERARDVIPNFSLDLIFGTPGQSPDEWISDLNRALEFGPSHISTYGLTFEKGTPLWKQMRHGIVQPLDEVAELQMYLDAIDILESAGFEQYEISNFARPGQRCRHNEVYWANEAYLGFGVGAARYVAGRRELNTRSLDGYIRKVLAGESPTFQSERLGPTERAIETVAIQLRRAEGIACEAFRDQTGIELDSLVGPRIREYVSLGLLADDGGSVRLTRRGKCVADAVIEGLMR